VHAAVCEYREKHVRFASHDGCWSFSQAELEGGESMDGTGAQPQL
jgi:hypothetical protein